MENVKVDCETCEQAVKPFLYLDLHIKEGVRKEVWLRCPRKILPVAGEVLGA